MTSLPNPPFAAADLPIRDPREADDEVEDEAVEGAVYTPWRFREGEGTPVRLVRVARRHPWSPGVELPAVAAPSPGLAGRLQAQAMKLNERVIDRWRGRIEQWHQRRHGRPSRRAVDEWLAYYQGLYRGHEPQPVLFARLLGRNGTPDWPNPFREGDPGYYDFHPEGLLSADLEAILRGIQQDWAAVRHRSEEVERHRQSARLCWALVVSRSDSLGHVMRRTHVANLNLATVDAASAAGLSALGLTPETVMAGAIARGWQPRDAAGHMVKMLKALSD